MTFSKLSYMVHAKKSTVNFFEYFLSNKVQNENVKKMVNFFSGILEEEFFFKYFIL